MAYLELNVGNITQQITAGDANATRILQGVLTQYGYDIGGMNGNQQATAVLDVLRNFLQEAAQANEVDAAVDSARSTALADPPTFNGG